MFTTLHDFAPYVVALTVILSCAIGFGLRRISLRQVDSMVAALGVAAGLLVTFLNLKYSNNYIITLGPIVTFVCLLYLKYCDRIVSIEMPAMPAFQRWVTKVIGILFWITLSIVVVIYYLAPPYTRPVAFFVGISICVTLLGLEIVSSKPKGGFFTATMIGKIFLTSLVLRASAYYISPYPVGSDPWAHAEYIRDFINFAHLKILDYPYGTGMNDTYIMYPVMHLFAVATVLVCNLDIKNAMFIIGVLIVISTIFVYLIAKRFFGNDTLALLAILLLNFAEYYLQWGIQIIAMSFGIVLYIILLYLIVKNYYNPRKTYLALIVLFVFLILWTHTISSFIALLSFVTIFIVGMLYHSAYKKPKNVDVLSALVIVIFGVVLVTRWTTGMDVSDSSFLGQISTGLNSSLSMNAGFLSRTGDVFSAERNISQLLNIVGILILIAFGILGCLHCLAEKHVNKAKASLIFVVGALFFVFFAFPTMAMKNIMPNRWPAFIYASLTIFSGLGIMLFMNNIRARLLKIAAFALILFVYTFFMITNYAANVDSNIYSIQPVGKLSYKESDIALYTKISEIYSGMIVCDSQAGIRPFEVYLRYPRTMSYPMSQDQSIDLEDLRNKATIWDKSLGVDFKDYLDDNFNAVVDTGEDKAYV